MPWTETDTQKQRPHFDRDDTSGQWSMGEIWSADFKRQFKTGDGRDCFPLTVAGPLQSHAPALQGAAFGSHRRRQARLSLECLELPTRAPPLASASVEPGAPTPKLDEAFDFDQTASYEEA